MIRHFAGFGWLICQSQYAPLDIQDSAEMANPTIQQYGSCTPRTHAERPANNTPLTIMAKAGFPGVDDATYEDMIDVLVIQGLGSLGLVDNHGANAVMHAAGHSNIPFFMWFYRRAWVLRDEFGFSWNQKHNAEMVFIFLGIVRRDLPPCSRNAHNSFLFLPGRVRPGPVDRISASPHFLV